MKYPKKYLVVAALFLALFIYGCASTNPNAGKPVIDPATGLQVTNAAGIPLVQPPVIPNALGTSLVGYVNKAVPIIPAPYGDLVALLAAVGTLVMGKIAQSKNNQLAAVVQGVEDSTNAPTVTGASVKSAIQARATAAGVQATLDATVQKLT